MQSSLLALALVLPFFAGCAVIYPEIGTRTRNVIAGQPVEPPPPPDLKWVHFVSAVIPERTRDGRPWQKDGLATTYAKLLINGKEALKTPVESGTLTPTWPTGPKGNFRIAREDHLEIELWTADPVVDKPIIIRELGVPSDDQLDEKVIRVEEDTGASLILAFEPAHAVEGLGLWFELRERGCAITRILKSSPAERAGVGRGDEVLKIGIHNVKDMTPAEVQSAFSAVPVHGLPIVVKHPNGTLLDIVLKEGPIYAHFDEFGSVD